MIVIVDNAATRPVVEAKHIFLRTPFFPFKLDWGDSFDKRLLERKEFLEAIYLASPSLFHEFHKNGMKSSDRVLGTLHKYYVRMSSRCTPFGMFSGVSVGQFDKATSIRLAEHAEYKKTTRLDHFFIDSFIQTILEDPAAKKDLTWYQNNTIYQSQDSHRYIESIMINSRRSYQLSTVRSSIYLEKVLEVAKCGGKLAELIESLLQLGIQVDEARSFINEVIDNKLLLSEIELKVTGLELQFELVKRLKKYQSTQPYAEFLERILNKLKLVAGIGSAINIDIYQGIWSEINAWKPGFNSSLIFQSDLVKPIHSFTLNSSIQSELRSAIYALARISEPKERKSLNLFKEEFARRYDSEEVPLLEVLDPESGIGYPTNNVYPRDNCPLLEDLVLNSPQKVAGYTLTKRLKLLMKLYEKSISEKESEIILNEMDITGAAEPSQISMIESQLPASFCTVFQILAASSADVDNDKFELVHVATRGPSAVNYLTRFCHTDQKIHDSVKELIELEENQGINGLYAEIVHSPNARATNIMLRPNLRQYEIPILTTSMLGESQVVQLNDIMVSVISGYVRLRSKRLNREIIPRQSTAHEFSNNTIPVYHFLCDLQYQQPINSLKWDWGLLEEFEYLPRVKFGKVILSTARWIIKLANLGLEKSFQAETFIALFKAYKESRNIPSFVILSDGDSKLLLNLDDALSLNILLIEIRKKQFVILEESLFNDNNLLVESSEGKFTNEFIIPWTKKECVVKEGLVSSENRCEVHIERNFDYGSEWLYVKLYAGVKSCDDILINILMPLTEQLLKSSLISRWFFVRYNESGHHLRVRFNGKNGFHNEVLKLLVASLEPLTKGRVVSKIQTENYRRELERYGAWNMANSEQYFFVDSSFSAKALSLLDGDHADQLRWLFAMKGMDDTMNLFNKNVRQKEEFTHQLYKAFLTEIEMSEKELKRKMSSFTRINGKTIECYLQNEVDQDFKHSVIWELFSDRVSRLKPLVHFILDLETLNIQAPRVDELMNSYIHMFVNRFMRSRQRLQEMVLYYQLNQYYRSVLARNKVKGNG